MRSPLVLLLLLAAAVLAAAAGARAEIGFDFSYYQGYQPVSLFQCFAANGIGFGIVQAQIGSEYNPNVAQDVANAHAAGIPYVDVYWWPDPSSDPAAEAKALVAELMASGTLSTNMLWLDIESPGAWGTDYSGNVDFIGTAISTIESMYNGCGLASCVGIYTSEYEWSAITGGTTQFAGYQLWVADWDYVPYNNGIYPFGGWTSAAMKQYETGSLCGVDIDFDCY